ncbi:hypothetical protein E3N88_19394 [Mikania micrantha]|uniref:Uncharacterized protein n=1 Tax=Mikania micrantha TaxID=192012 RepID=A0A5N6NQT6_9ASTR|nr:hypothetical protein E3N88_19394 [Mikania micrantha]
MRQSCSLDSRRKDTTWIGIQEGLFIVHLQQNQTALISDSLTISYPGYLYRAPMVEFDDHGHDDVDQLIEIGNHEPVANGHLWNLENGHLPNQLHGDNNGPVIVQFNADYLNLSLAFLNSDVNDQIDVTRIANHQIVGALDEETRAAMVNHIDVVGNALNEIHEIVASFEARFRVLE